MTKEEMQKIKEKVSPVIEQYLDIKMKHLDHILFFRLGDFYEMFFDDAVVVAKELELTLTGKDCGLEERAPMCGVPFHASAVYIKKLIEKGFKVAICEQVESASQAKGLVKRDVIRVVTPGTVIEGDMLEDSSNNYICSLYVKGKTFTSCFCDISTGKAYLTEQKTADLNISVISELSKFAPSEIICNLEVSSKKEILSFVKDKLNCILSYYEHENIDLSDVDNKLTKHFGEHNLQKLDLEENAISRISLCAMIEYLNNIQKDGAKRLDTVNVYQENQFMNIDITAKRNLEITQTMRTGEKKGTLLWVLDKTKTSMGKRFMKNALEQPLLNMSTIIRRQNSINELTLDSIALSELQDSLSNIYDLERLLTRVIYGSASPREVRSLASTANNLPQIKMLLESKETNLLCNINADIDTLEDIRNLVDNAIVEEPPFLLKDGGYIKAGFNETLDEYINIRDNAKSIMEEIEKRERELTNIPNLKIKYNKVFGYYIEVTKSYLDLVPNTYIRKQTLTNAERYITEELKELETKVLTANEKILVIENEIFNEVKKYIASRVEVIQATSNAVAELDFLCSLAFVAMKNNYVMPEISLDNKIDIIGGRHPVVESIHSDMPFVPNDVKLDTDKNQMMVITGPNMAGKSTYMRQVAIITIMAQIGSFVPAQRAKISVVDKIFTRVGASDDLSAGQSTFMVEMSEVAHILKHATNQSLVILDEIGRGTSTFDGMSIAKAVVEYICNTKKLKCKTMFATHYHELTTLEDELKGVKNYNIAVQKHGDDITFLRKIVSGGADESFGIEVAKLAGVPNKVVSRAKEILSELESSSGVIRVVEKSNTEQTQQLGFNSYVSQVEEKLNLTAIDNLTPIEALNLLYELKKLL